MRVQLPKKPIKVSNIYFVSNKTQCGNQNPTFQYYPQTFNSAIPFPVFSVSLIWKNLQLKIIIDLYALEKKREGIIDQKRIIIWAAPCN